MRKQYIDFVPAGKPVTKKKSARQAAGVVSVSAANKRSSREAEGVNLGGVVGFSDEKQPKLGAVEDLNARFVRTDVPKRPLSRSHFGTATEKTGVKAVKAQKVGVKATGKVASGRVVEKPVEKSEGRSVGRKNAGVYQAPKTPFINQGKVQKRPLSKNVYAKKVPVVAKGVEESKGPVTIISKPEKQAHVGMIVTIILTIILGAAAGTVAFLLLPK